MIVCYCENNRLIEYRINFFFLTLSLVFSSKSRYNYCLLSKYFRKMADDFPQNANYSSIDYEETEGILWLYLNHTHIK